MNYWIIQVEEGDRPGTQHCAVMKGCPFLALHVAQGAAREYTGKQSGRRAIVLMERDAYESKVVVEHSGLADSSDVGADIPGGGAR